MIIIIIRLLWLQGKQNISKMTSIQQQSVLSVNIITKNTFTANRKTV